MRLIVATAACLLAIACLPAADLDITGKWMATGPFAASPSISATGAALPPDIIAPGDLEFDIDKDTITATVFDPDQPVSTPPQVSKESFTVVNRGVDTMVIQSTNPDNKNETTRATITRKGTGFTLDDGNIVITFIPLDPAAVEATRKKRMAAASASTATPKP
jgi:hypothetical protein